MSMGVGWGGGGGSSASNTPTFFNSINDFRLTLTTVTPVTTVDVIGATTIYFTPYKGNRISLYDSSSLWYQISSSEISLALGTLTSGLNYDVFVYSNSGVLTIDTLVAWTNDTTRATALVRQDGVWCKTGALTRRYVGTIRATGVATTEDSAAKRFVWNADNRVPRTMEVRDSTDSWTYSTATFRAANNSTANRLDYVVGLSVEPVWARVFVAVFNDQVGGANVTSGVGVDSTTVNSARHFGGYPRVQNIPVISECFYEGFPGIGFHFLQWLEYSQAVPTTTWVGDNGSTTIASRIYGEVYA